MIIQCGNCSRKFSVKDSDIPDSGRKVQCGNCSVTWFQMPTLQLDEFSEKLTPKINKRKKSKRKISKVRTESHPNENFSIEDPIEASNGKVYKFLGSQWGELLSSGKTGMLATKKIAKELNDLTKNEAVSNLINPSSEQFIQKETKKGMGFFAYIFLFLIIALTLVGAVKTFETELLMYFPQSEYVFERGEYIFETMENMITIIKDLINSY